MEAECFLYTRTPNKDFRWIYKGNSLTFKEALEIQNDFNFRQILYRTQTITLNLFVRRYENKFCVYKINNVGSTLDSSSRQVHALEGYVFGSKEYERFFANFSLILSDIFCGTMNITKDITDRTKNEQMSISYSLDNLKEILSFEKKSNLNKGQKKILKVRQFIDKFLLSSPLEECFLITEENEQVNIGLLEEVKKERDWVW